MAGIFGYLSQEIDKISLDNMVRTINEQGYCITHSILNRSCVLGKLGFESSKVNELTERKDRLSIVTCGEIYNEDIEDLDKSILTLYENGDLDRLKDLNGSFAAAIYDRTEDKLTLVNDRYGLIKLFYYYDKTQIIIQMIIFIKSLFNSVKFLKYRFTKDISKHLMYSFRT